MTEGYKLTATGAKTDGNNGRFTERLKWKWLETPSILILFTTVLLRFVMHFLFLRLNTCYELLYSSSWNQPDAFLLHFVGFRVKVKFVENLMFYAQVQWFALISNRKNRQTDKHSLYLEDFLSRHVWFCIRLEWIKFGWKKRLRLCLLIKLRQVQCGGETQRRSVQHLYA